MHTAATHGHSSGRDMPIQQEDDMPEAYIEKPLQPGDRAPNVVLDAITREGKVAIDDFRGQKPVLVGLFRGLHCPFCRRQIAAMAELAGDLKQKGVDSLTVVNTPINRARLYFRYHPIPSMLAASDPERVSHRAFGLPNLIFTDQETSWPRQVNMDQVKAIKVDQPYLPGPMDVFSAIEYLDKTDQYEHTDEDQQAMAGGYGQLVGQFLLDRDGVVRWAFTEYPDNGRHMFDAPTRQEVMSAASRVVN
jgi:peroxiredoxin